MAPRRGLPITRRVILTAWAVAAAGASGAAPARNVVVIVLDTVRADRVGRPGLTPHLDAFAKTAVRFDAAFAQAPWTLPSVASLLTSRLPGEHHAGGRLGRFTRLDASVPTLAALYRKAGGRTGAVVNVLFLGDSFGLTRGYDETDVEAPDRNEVVRRAAATTDAALALLDRLRESGKPTFLFVHYFDAHLTYDPPQPFRRRFADPVDGRGTATLFGSIAEMVELRQGKRQVAPALVRRLEKLYDGEIAYLDREVGRLLKGLEGRGLDRDTVVVVTSDHGEEFLEHGGFEHGHTLYDELLHVPLLIRAPSRRGHEVPEAVSRAGHRVSSVVRLIDVAPTVCALAGVPPDPGFSGESLVPLLSGKTAADRPSLAEANLWNVPARSLRRDGLKLIRQTDGQRVELYDVGGDPGERRDIGGSRPEERARLVEALSAPAPARKPGADAALTDEQRERLRSLGYVGN